MCSLNGVGGFDSFRQARVAKLSPWKLSFFFVSNTQKFCIKKSLHSKYYFIRLRFPANIVSFILMHL